MFDLEDILGGGSSVPGMGNMFPEGGLLVAIAIIAIIGLFVCAWSFCGFTRRNIGRKAGLTKDWMAFVPFARTVYFLEIVGEQWWKMFIFEMWPFYWWLIGQLFGLFNHPTMTTFGNVIAAIYLVAVLVYKIYFRVKFYKTFNIKSDLALGASATIWGVVFLRRVFECLIAFTDMFQYGDASKQRGFGEVTMPGPQQMHKIGGGAPRASAPSASSGCSITGLSGMYANQTIPMAPNDELIIGRDAALANIIIDQMADKVSRKHCGIRYDAGRGVYMVTDYSSNGTLVEGGSRLVANVPQPCNKGTILVLGSRENRFKLN